MVVSVIFQLFFLPFDITSVVYVSLQFVFNHDRSFIFVTLTTLNAQSKLLIMGSYEQFFVQKKSQKTLSMKVGN